jgi:hypothetical protein
MNNASILHLSQTIPLTMQLLVLSCDDFIDPVTKTPSTLTHLEIRAAARAGAGTSTTTATALSNQPARP